MRWLLAGLLLFAGIAARADEAADHGVPPQSALRQGDYHAPTPVTLPGARTVTTLELRRLLQDAEARPPALIDVLGGDGHATLPGAVWLPGAGRGESFDDALQPRLEQALAALTAGDRDRALVFFCANAHCWLSYNAALRAVRLGYRQVLWYRGGVEAWGAGGGALAPPRLAWKPPA